MKKKIAILSGAGVSADSGLETFRDSDGLWAKYRIEDVCTPEALEKNPKLVLQFYNERRRQLKAVKPNAGHFALASLEEYFDVNIITQNVDNLHERAGSRNVLHLHGELTKCRSMKNPDYIVEVDGDIQLGDCCPEGGQLRPHIVFFGEAVPNLQYGAELISKADILIVVGTSLAVYPAASLIHYAPENSELFVVDPSDISISGRKALYIRERGAVGLPLLCNKLLQDIAKS